MSNPPGRQEEEGASETDEDQSAQIRPDCPGNNPMQPVKFFEKIREIGGPAKAIFDANDKRARDPSCSQCRLGWLHCDSDQTYIKE